MSTGLIYALAGASLLLAVVLPPVLERWAVSAPMVLVGVGMVIGLLPQTDGLSLDPLQDRAAIEHVTEVAVVVALMGVGLALDRPLGVRQWRSWLDWSPTWRLLAVAMPLSIAGVAVLGWWVAGLAPASALLLGAVLAPTDPVLASDVQVAGPATGEHQVGEPNEVRFALTSEAGLNDGLAFPFVYAAILLAAGQTSSGDVVGWFGWHLVGRTVVGVVVGVAVGWALSQIAFRSQSRSLRLAERGEPLLVVAVLATSYGLGQLSGGYGFLSVFTCALAFRSAERNHDYHLALHEVVERLEQLLTLFVLLVLGVALTHGLLKDLDWRGVGVGLALVLLIRPLAAMVALEPWRRAEAQVGGMSPRQRWATAFFGVRGVGSLYYLAYAGGRADFAERHWLWSTVVFTIVASVMVHGIAATPVMRRLDPDGTRA